MLAEVRKELVCRKRKAELQWVFLPDAPPRKRQLRKPSPVREACHLLHEPAVEELAVEEPAVDPVVEEPAVGEPAVEKPLWISSMKLTPEADTSHNAPNSSPSRLLTALSLEYASKSLKRGLIVLHLRRNKLRALNYLIIHALNHADVIL